MRLFTTDRQIKRMVSEAVERITASSEAADPDESQWTRLTQGTRDLTPMEQDKMIDLAFWLYQNNPLANRMSNLMTDFVLGEGVSFKASDERVQALLQDFWDRNEWSLRQDPRIRELGLFGEQFYRAFVNAIDGKVRIGAADPKTVDKVVKNAENAEEIVAVVFKGNPAEYPVIRESRDAQDAENYGKLTGDVFVFQVNVVTTASRGISDIQPIMDWLDLYDKSLFTMTERVAFLLAFVWDVTITGADKDEIKARLGAIMKNPPKPGSVRVHNDKEKWDALAPGLGGSDLTPFFKLLKAQILGGSGVPEHWLGEGGSTNFATAEKMDAPVFKMIKKRQLYVAYMFERMFDFCIDRAIVAEKLPRDVDRKFVVSLPDPSRDDVAATADGMAKLAQPLALAGMNKWLSSETIRSVFVDMVRKLGYSIDPADEKKRTEQESAAPAVYQAMGALRAALSGKDSAKLLELVREAVKKAE